MDDLIKRLRIWDSSNHLMSEAADEIERLREACLMYDRKLHEKDLEIDTVTQERDKYHHALQVVSEIECVDDLWRAQEILNQLPAMKEQTT